MSCTFSSDEEDYKVNEKEQLRLVFNLCHESDANQDSW